MSHKKHGQLTTSPEWGRHLRRLMRRFFWKGERRAERNLSRAEAWAAGFGSEIDPRHAVLLGTYATWSMAEIIAEVLRSEGIAVRVVRNGREGAFPPLDLVGDGVGLFVSLGHEAAARAIAWSIEFPTSHRP